MPRLLVEGDDFNVVAVRQMLILQLPLLIIEGEAEGVRHEFHSR